MLALANAPAPAPAPADGILLLLLLFLLFDSTSTPTVSARRKRYQRLEGDSLVRMDLACVCVSDVFSNSSGTEFYLKDNCIELSNNREGFPPELFDSSVCLLNCCYAVCLW